MSFLRKKNKDMDQDVLMNNKMAVKRNKLPKYVMTSSSVSLSLGVTAVIILAIDC